MDKESSLNTPKTMCDIECWEATQFIKLPFFLAVLKFSPLTRGSDTTEVFFRLMDKGLPLRFSEPGYCFDDEKIHKSDVKCALRRIDDALFETNQSENKLFAGEIIKTEAGNEISLAGILIDRNDVSDIFAQMGFKSYPWAKVPWPIKQTDFSDFPINQSDASNNHAEIASEYHDKKLTKINDELTITEEKSLLSFLSVSCAAFSKIGSD